MPAALEPHGSNLLKPLSSLPTRTMSGILDIVLRNDKACYPCIAHWAHNYVKSDGNQIEVICEFDHSSSACWDCLDDGHICAPVPGLLSGDRILFFTIFKHVNEGFFTHEGSCNCNLDENTRLKVSNGLAALAEAFVRLVETHKAEFHIDGARENDPEALASYRSAIYAREASMKASFLPLHHGATFEEKVAYDKACTPRLSNYDRGRAAWAQAFYQTTLSFKAHDELIWEECRAKIQDELRPYGISL
ncbi:hypothetical protein PG988_010484 [Apiospora saccharicola]